MTIQEAKLNVAQNDLNAAQAQLDAKQAELDKVQALYDKAVQEKQVNRAEVWNVVSNFTNLVIVAKLTIFDSVTRQ